MYSQKVKTTIYNHSTIANGIYRVIRYDDIKYSELLKKSYLRDLNNGLIIGVTFDIEG